MLIECVGYCNATGVSKKAAFVFHNKQNFGTRELQDKHVSLNIN